MRRSLPTSEELVKTCPTPQYFHLRKSAVEVVVKKMSSGAGGASGSINLHGHSHGRLKPLPRQFECPRDFARPVLALPPR
jgi:hypothetical protein